MKFLVIGIEFAQCFSHCQGNICPLNVTKTPAETIRRQRQETQFRHHVLLGKIA